MATKLKALNAVGSIRNFVQNIGELPVDEDGQVNGKESDGLHNKIQPGVMDLEAVGGFAACVTTLILTEGHIVDAASYSTAALAPYAAYQKHNLQKLGGMRGQQNTLREHVGKLTDENTTLSSRLDKLEAQVDRLEHVEEKLEKVAKEGKSTVEHLMKVQEKLTEYNVKMKDIMATKMLSVLFGIILESDRDRNFALNPQEIMMMILRLKSVQGVNFNEENFRKILPDDPREPVELPDIMKVVWNLEDQSIPVEDRVFSIHPEQLLKR